MRRATDCSHDANPYDLLYVVGAFDTICKTCQQQYCSAGVWTGQEFDKVGVVAVPFSSRGMSFVFLRRRYIGPVR